MVCGSICCRQYLSSQRLSRTFPRQRGRQPDVMVSGSLPPPALLGAHRHESSADGPACRSRADGATCKWGSPDLRSDDVREWKRRGLLRPGQMFPVSWNRAGVPCGSISVRTESDAVVLIFRSQHPGETEWKSTEQRVPILWSPDLRKLSSLAIDVREWKRRGLLRPGQMFPVSWNRAGVPCGSISVRTESDAVVLIFRSQHPGETEWKSTEQRVPILWTACHLGGRRPGSLQQDRHSWRPPNWLCLSKLLSATKKGGCHVSR